MTLKKEAVSFGLLALILARNSIPLLVLEPTSSEFRLGASVG